MLKKIAPDKWKHFYVGILLGAVLQVLAWWFLPASPWIATIIVFALVVVVCYGFELYSKITGHGHYEIADAIAGILGGIIGIVAVLMAWLL